MAVHDYLLGIVTVSLVSILMAAGGECVEYSAGIEYIITNLHRWKYLIANEEFD